MINLIGNIFHDFFHDFTNWGIGQFFSIVVSVIIIVFSMPFTYIGGSIRRVVVFRFKGYEGYAIRKYTINAIMCVAFLLIIEVVLFFVLNISKFYSITYVIALMIILGLMGLKLTFGMEEMFDVWIDDVFS
jgi:hypothetical protein